MSRATIDAALRMEQQRRHHGMLMRREDNIEMELQQAWSKPVFLQVPSQRFGFDPRH